MTVYRGIPSHDQRPHRADRPPLSIQLNEVLHHPASRSWKVLARVKLHDDQSETSVMLEDPGPELLEERAAAGSAKAPEFDRSAAFKKIYEEEFGVFGGEPIGAVIGDFEFGKHPEDLELLEKMSQVAAAAHAPFLTAAAASLLNMESYTNLDQPRDLAKIFDTTEYAK